MERWIVCISCLLAALLLSACADSQVNKNNPVKALAIAVNDDKPSRVKPGLGVYLISPQQLIPDGVPADINLSLHTDVLQGQTEVTLELPDELELLAGSLNHRFTQAEKEMRIELTVYARAPGKHYINLIVKNDATTRRRALSAIVWAGENIDSLKALETRPAKTDEGAVRELPAEETIR